MTERVAVVTGASSGIGRQVATDLAGRGWRVCVAARRGERLTALVLELGGDAAGHRAVVTDVGDVRSVGRLADEVRRGYGRCDLLVNNAGFSANRALDAPDALSVVEDVLRVNFLGAVACTHTLLPLLEAAAPSHVVNVASVAGRIPVSGNAPYSASKFALVAWTEAVRAELAGRGVHVHLVEPGPVPTEGFPQRALREHPVGRLVLASPADVSRAVLEVVARDRLRRTVPGGFALLPALRALLPGPFQAVAERLLAERRRREQTAG